MNSSPLAIKLAKILGDVGSVQKTGYNAFHKYHYVTENDLVYAVRGRLAEAGIFVFSSVEDQKTQIVTDEKTQKQSMLTTVTMKHTFVDGESGDSFSVLSQGQGADASDKGGYKATTGAMKYFLYKCFMIPTGDDPEQDHGQEENRQQQSLREPEVKHTPAPQPERQAARTLAPAPDKALPLTFPGKRTPAMSTAVAQFIGGKWGSVKIHFGKNKGKALHEMASKQLNWYADEWEPKPYGQNATISEDDTLLRAALDAYIMDNAPKVSESTKAALANRPAAGPEGSVALPPEQDVPY